jgi:hypothetical protein
MSENLGYSFSSSPRAVTDNESRDDIFTHIPKSYHSGPTPDLPNSPLNLPSKGPRKDRYGKIINRSLLGSAEDYESVHVGKFNSI